MHASSTRRRYNSVSGSAHTRGGSWNDESFNLRAANRNHNTPDNHNRNVGFRLARHLTGAAKCHTVPQGAGWFRFVSGGCQR
ncbi:SUMF1/EgtB/PvdO family nonheme iron enzyme [Candidatus Chloroploca sp. Khr17]|uniref:SUMF1/EgtB/PvdO family nonheme iron enzyme n=1 Tax=Candidatus Chloroploca sp. Khr17 TaxID=2496869 RepID=UPI00101D5C94